MPFCYTFDDSYSYEENCEEIEQYMTCECETFDFGEGLMDMRNGGESGTYKANILSYLNYKYYPEHFKWTRQDEEKYLNKLAKSMTRKQIINDSRFVDKKNKQLKIELYDDSFIFIDDRDIECYFYSKESLKRKVGRDRYFNKIKHKKDARKKYKPKLKRHLKRLASKSMRNGNNDLIYFHKGSVYKKAFWYTGMLNKHDYIR